MTYRTFFWFRTVIAAGAFVFAAWSIFHLGSSQVRAGREYFVVFFWVLGPPLWFLAEYYALDQEFVQGDPDLSKREMLESAKNYAEYASKVWGAVLAAVLLLFQRLGV